MFKRKTVSHKYAARARPETTISSVLPLGMPVGAAIIVVAAFLAYIPCLSGRFVLDDDVFLTDNPLIQATDGPYRYWCTSEAMDFWPATSTTLWIEWRLWESSPTGYHVTSLILHVAESLLIWIILRRLTIPGAFFAALLFAVHPVNVESVAWISQRKNIMAMLFFLLSILWYLKADMPTARVGTAPIRSHGGPWERENGQRLNLYYWLSLAAFVLAMLGKGSAAVLPVLLLGIVWWMRPLTRRDLLCTAPFFLISALLTAVNVWFQTHGAEIVTRSDGFTQRLLGAGGVMWFYLYKAILPFDLAFVYRQWHIEIANLLWWMPLLAALAVTAALWRYRQTWARPLLFAWGFFCVALAPVMGFADVGFMQYSLVADHYQHIAIIGVIALAAAFWSVWRQSMRKKSRWAATLAAVAAAGSLALLAWQQSANYRDAVTLYHTTLQKNPDCWMAHNNLGGTLARAGLLQEALEHYGQALRLRPDYPEAHNNLGSLMSDTGHVPEAIEHYQKALKLKPDYADAHNNLGNAFTDQGRVQEAIEQFEQALRIKPNYSDAHNNLGVVLVQTGKLPEAIEHFKQALQFKPDYINAYTNLALTYSMLHQPSQAVAAAQKALEIARSQEQAEQATRIENWLNSYRAGAPDVPNPPSPSKTAAPTP
ncbi:MAG: tetratricopeptide repeat protein [Thermoguttaceae bacterium]|jgi:Tfp pilus assembly protein PilF